MQIEEEEKSLTIVNTRALNYFSIWKKGDKQSKQMLVAKMMAFRMNILVSYPVHSWHMIQSLEGQRGIQKSILKIFMW
jgi:hypothetical protein